jgi:CheY-like chemotaxis protein
LAELMDGAIGVTSEQGFGSQFWAEIPALPIGVPEEGPTKDGNGPLQIPGGCRVLLAEDNAINVKVALRSLALMGCTVQVAENGIVAIAKALNEDFDLVLMDVMMPECDGLEAARTIRAHEQSRGNRHVPIIALTANGLKGDREVCIDAGMDDFLAKPFTVDRLRSTLHKWVPANQADRLAA